MKPLVSCVLLISTTIGVATAADPKSDTKWLPLSRPELARVISKGMNLGSLEFQTIDEYLDSQRIKLQSKSKELERIERYFARRSKRLAPDDTIWIVSEPAVPFMVVMAGRGEHIHSLRVTVPVVKYLKGEVERVYSFLSDLFEAIYPDWPEAKNWPRRSLNEAWSMHHFVRKETYKEPDKVFIRKKIGGVTSTTFGVPPDVVYYTFTVRERCIPAYSRGNPLNRVIC